MHVTASLVAALLAMPMAYAQLNELAKKAGKLYFGTATDNGELTNKKYLSILTNTKLFGQLTPANGMKWMYVEPSQNVFNFTPGSLVASLAAEDHQLLRCHNLVWHNQLAPWVTAKNWTKPELIALLVNHVYTEASHWKGKCYAWDVVNEGLNEDGTYRSDIFYDTLGEDYFKIAFETAAKADPKAKLYYNDYNIEYPGVKSAGAIRIVKMLKKAGIRIDGVGLQSHFIVGETPSIDAQIANMKSFTALGVEVAQTELDIRMPLPANASSLAQQSKDFESTVGACVQVKGCVGTTVWDFYDPFSWVNGFFTGMGNATLWFDNFTVHPAYYGVEAALKNYTKPGKPPGHYYRA